MELKDTVKGMLSKDYQERFVAEYQQVKIRELRLEKIVDGIIKGEIDFEPQCGLDLLMQQRAAMELYMAVLEQRADLEEIVLP